MKRKGYTIPGFRPGATLAAPYLFKIFGEEQVLQLSFKFMGNAIQVLLHQYFPVNIFMSIAM